MCCGIRVTLWVRAGWLAGWSWRVQQIRPYDEIFSYLSSLASQGKKIWLDADKSNYALLQAAVGSDVAAHEVEEKASKAVVTKPSPITLLKAIKVLPAAATDGLTGRERKRLVLIGAVPRVLLLLWLWAEPCGAGGHASLPPEGRGGRGGVLGLAGQDAHQGGPRRERDGD